MSYDVQLFVACDHLIKVPGLPNPTNSLTLTVTNNDSAYLTEGTYYINYSLNNENGETLTNEYTKIYLNRGQVLNIKFDMFQSPNDADNASIFARVYVGYAPMDLTQQNLTQDQLDTEMLTVKNMKEQGTTNDGTFYLNGPLVEGKLQPSGNSTNIKSFASYSSSCPRCYGKNYYFDIFFDAAGQAVTAESSTKLLQELIKVVIEDKGDNIYHTDWGCDITKRIGTKKRGPADKFKVEMAVRNAVEYLKGVQESNQRDKKNMIPQEMIDSISSITVEEDGPLGYNVYVEVLSKAGEVIAYNVNV